MEWKIVKKAAVLLAFVLLNSGLPQQATSTAQEAARLLPADALLYLELRDIPDGIEKFEPWLAQFLGAKDAKQLSDDVRTALKKELAFVPGKLHDDSKDAIKNLKSVYAAFYKMGEKDWRGAVILESAKDGAFETLLDDLKTQFTEVLEHRKTSIVRWWVNESPLKNLYFAALGRRFGIAATHLDLVKTAIERAQEKANAPSLADNELFQKLSASSAKTSGFALNLFFDIRKFLHDSLVNGRKARMSFDRIDAALDIRKIKGVTFSVAVEKDGTVLSEGALLVDKDCAVYELLRQEATTKELLSLLPSDSMYTLVFGCQEAPKLWKKIKNLVTENAAAFEIKADDFEAELEKAKEEMGISIDELADTLGDFEVAVFIPELNVAGIGMGNVPNIGFALKVNDAKKLATAWEKVSAKIKAQVGKDKFKTKEVEGYKICYWKEREGRGMPNPKYAYAVVDKYLFFSLGTKPIEQMIKLYKSRDAGSLAEDKKVQGALEKLGAKKNAAVQIVHTQKLMELFEGAIGMAQGMGGAKLPDFLSELSFKERSKDIRDVAVFIDTDEGIVFKSSGTGAGQFLTLLPTAAIAIPSFLRSPYGGNPPELLEEQEVAQVESLKLPEKEAERKQFIDQLVKNLNDDDWKVRVDATEKLKAVGPKLALEAVKAAREKGDAEVKERASQILSYWRCYDAVPEKAKEMFDGFIQKITPEVNQSKGAASFSANGPRFEWGWGGEWGYNLTGEDLEIVRCEYGVRKLAELLNSEESTELKRNVAYFLTAFNAKSVSKSLLQRYSKTADKDLKLLTLVALGWSAENKEVRKLLLEALSGDNENEREAAFYALERSSDTDTVKMLFGFLAHKDEKVRFNAGYTLEKITHGKTPPYNAFAKEKVRIEHIKAIEEWWKVNKDTPKLVPPRHFLH